MKAQSSPEHVQLYKHNQNGTLQTKSAQTVASRLALPSLKRLQLSLMVFLLNLQWQHSILSANLSLLTVSFRYIYRLACFVYNVLFTDRVCCHS